jgi:hypothetical protein
MYWIRNKYGYWNTFHSIWRVAEVSTYTSNQCREILAHQLEVYMIVWPVKCLRQDSGECLPGSPFDQVALLFRVSNLQYTASHASWVLLSKTQQATTWILYLTQGSYSDQARLSDSCNHRGPGLSRAVLQDPNVHQNHWVPSFTLLECNVPQIWSTFTSAAKRPEQFNSINLSHPVRLSFFNSGKLLKSCIEDTYGCSYLAPFSDHGNCRRFNFCVAAQGRKHFNSIAVDLLYLLALKKENFPSKFPL